MKMFLAQPPSLLHFTKQYFRTFEICGDLGDIKLAVYYVDDDTVDSIQLHLVVS